MVQETMGRTKLKVIGKRFLRNTSMHGLKYLAEDGHSKMERLLWVFIFAIGVCISLYLCLRMWIKYETSPSTMSIESTNRPLRNFEFPSVTICSQNKISKSKLDLVMDNARYENLSASDLMFIMRVMIKIDSAFNRTGELVRLHKMATLNGLSPFDLVNMTLQTMVNCDDMLLECYWLNQPTPCSQLFSVIPTDDGLCCGFNHLEHGWRLNETEAKSQTSNLRRVTVPGVRKGLTVIADANLDDTTVSTARSNGFKILVHNARDFPDVSERGFSISPGFETYMGVEPISSYSSSNVDRIPISKRGCYYNFENPLIYYKDYSSSRCMMECLTKKMVETCGCHPYYYPAGVADRICNLNEYICLSEVNTVFRQNGSAAECSCLPSCDDFWINIQLSIGSFPNDIFLASPKGKNLLRRRMNVAAEHHAQYVKKNMAVLNVFYQEQVGMLYRNDLRYSVEDFVSAMGGSLSLGFGVSIVSVVEIAYFFVVHYYLSRRHDRSTQNKSTGMHQMMRHYWKLHKSQTGRPAKSVRPSK